MTDLQELARLAREAQASNAFWFDELSDGPFSVWANSEQRFIAAASPAVVMGLLKRLSDLEDATAHLIHCAKHFASEDREAPVESHNLFYAVDDAERALTPPAEKGTDNE